MKFRLLMLVTLAGLISDADAQWSVQPGIGLSIPITGYSTIVKSGIVYQLDVRKELNHPHWSIGLMFGWGRMHKDENVSDSFPNPRLDQVPIVVTGEYEFPGKKLSPYAGLGLGASLYNLSYDPTPVTGKTVTNVSFSLMPRLGVRLPVNEKIHPFLEANCPVVMDGPPIGVSRGEKVTGYVGIAAGVAFLL